MMLSKNSPKPKNVFIITLILSSVLYVQADYSSSYSDTMYKSNSIKRVYGETRYDTAIEASKYGWANGSDNLVITTGEDSSDSVCATTLALKLKAPVLLTKPNILEDSVMAEITRLNVKKVFIVGGLSAVGEGIEKILNSMNVSVNRLDGNSIYDTAFKIAKTIGQVDSIFVVSGINYTDALSVAPIAGLKGASVLLADNDNLSAEEYNYIKGIKDVYVVGGSTVISDKMLENFSNSHRIFGKDRYDTNISITNYFMDELDMSTSYFANGENIQEALSGTVLAGIKGSPLILANKKINENTKHFIESNSFLINNVVIIGGEEGLPSSQLSILTNDKGPNSNNPISLTTYEGSGQGCHPKVLYFKNGWNGWKYWMVFTPYANSDDLTENPSILTSNDGKAWEVPKKMIEPIIKGSGIKGIYNSDTHFLYNRDTDKIEMWYRNTAFNKLDKIYRCFSSNGIDWSEPQVMISSIGNEMILSPTILYEENKYKMWYVSYINDELRCEYIESINGIRWTSPYEVKLNLSESHLPWHLDIVHTDKGYEILLDSFKRGELKLNNRVLMWGVSKDGLMYNNITTILKPTEKDGNWDNQQIYRSTFVKVNGIYQLFYSAMDSKHRWHIGLSQGKDLLNLHGYN